MRAPFTANNLVIQPIHSEFFVAVLPASHTLARREAVTPRELAISPFILFPRAVSPGLHDTIIGLCIADGFSPIIIQEANAWLTVVGLVESGLGITIAPASASRVCPPAVACIPIVGTTDRATLAMVHDEGEISPLVLSFSNIARSTFSVCCRKHCVSTNH